jgi:aldehyde dehydrogenase (NAD+)
MKGYQKHYINGEWIQGSGSKKLINTNPFTGKELFSYQSAGDKNLEYAFDSAKTAQVKWEKTTPIMKQEYLEKLIQVVMEKKNEIFYWLREEGGSTVRKCTVEYMESIMHIKEAMAFPLMMDGKIIPSNFPGKENYVYRKPKGVIGIITPWNFPLLLAIRSIIPAVATGNTLVVKPSSDTPAVAFLIADMFENAGFPKGIINVIAGSGNEIGDKFLSHPVPDLISFTGSTSVGRHVGEVAGRFFKDVSLELGGNNAMVVFNDADIEQAARAAAFGAFFHQGQVCMALNRIIVIEAVYDKFVNTLVDIVRNFKVGDPADPNTFIGPVINSAQVKIIEELINATIQAGAKVALQGKTEGNVIHPWIFTDVTNGMPAANNEVFGPVCCLIRAANDEEALQIANNSEYGLSGSIFTGDIFYGIQKARCFKTGMVHVNDQSINDEPQVMFGGEKASGLGRFNAQWVVDKFTTEQWVSVQYKNREYNIN